MIEFGGVFYYIDLSAFEKAVTPVGVKPTDKITVIEKKTYKDNEGKLVSEEIVEMTNERGKEIDGSKYEVLRLLLETIIDFDDEIDDAMGAEHGLSKTPLSLKLAFNTLYNYGILKEKE